MAARSLNTFFSSPELARLSRIAHAQRQLERQWQAALPPQMAGLTRVVGVDGDCLVVSTRSPALVAKLRQMEMRLLARLSEGGLKVNAIQCRVQVELLPHEQKNPKRNLTLSPVALDALEAAAQSFPDSPLRDALAALVAKRRR
ncbi:MAG: DUF721 domain-containing protein [Burkholderiales bacterium]|nr:DUF721 domain-containing protein [Burkholderiales bacterium]